MNQHSGLWLKWRSASRGGPSPRVIALIMAISPERVGANSEPLLLEDAGRNFDRAQIILARLERQ